MIISMKFLIITMFRMISMIIAVILIVEITTCQAIKTPINSDVSGINTSRMLGYQTKFNINNY